MEWAGEGADGGGDNRIGIREGAGRDTGTEGAGVETVFRMQDQTLIKDPGSHWIWLTLHEHVQKIGGIGEIIPGLNRVLAFANQLKGRNHRRDFGDQPHHRVIDVLRIIDGTTGIKQPQGGRTGLKSIHRMPIRREALHHVPDAEADASVHLHLILKIS